MITDNFSQIPMKYIHNFCENEPASKQIQASSLGFNVKTQISKCETLDSKIEFEVLCSQLSKRKL